LTVLVFFAGTKKPLAGGSFADYRSSLNILCYLEVLAGYQ